MIQDVGAALSKARVGRGWVVIRREFDRGAALRLRIPASAVLSVGLLIASVAGAAACRGPQFHRSILLKEVPPKAQSSPVIALVAVMAIRARPSSHAFPRNLGVARVIDAVRGVQVGQVIEIEATGTSCGGGLDDGDVGKQGFIAGKLDDTGVFVGSWSNQDRNLDP